MASKFKCEKFVSDLLNKKGIRNYVPLISTIKKYRSKVKEYKIPLINCYVFVSITKAEYAKVLETIYVLKFIKQGRDLISIPEWEISILKRVAGEIDVQLVDQNLELFPGQKVEVISGQLTGIKGILIQSKNKEEFVVELSNIGIHLRIDINRRHLRPKS